jgi:hypothetical protein
MLLVLLVPNYCSKRSQGPHTPTSIYWRCSTIFGSARTLPSQAGPPWTQSPFWYYFPRGSRLSTCSSAGGASPASPIVAKNKVRIVRISEQSVTYRVPSLFGLVLLLPYEGLHVGVLHELVVLLHLYELRVLGRGVLQSLGLLDVLQLLELVLLVNGLSLRFLLGVVCFK